jgi:hypothetical protein
MRFYHNININVTAEEEWVADYLYQSGQAESREEVVEELQSKREFCGWYECQVSNTIEEALEYGKSTY